MDQNKPLRVFELDFVASISTTYFVTTAERDRVVADSVLPTPTSLFFDNSHWDFVRFLVITNTEVLGSMRLKYEEIYWHAEVTEAPFLAKTLLEDTTNIYKSLSELNRVLYNNVCKMMPSRVELQNNLHTTFSCPLFFFPLFVNAQQQILGIHEALVALRSALLPLQKLVPTAWQTDEHTETEAVVLPGLVRKRPWLCGRIAVPVDRTDPFRIDAVVDLASPQSLSTLAPLFVLFHDSMESFTKKTADSFADNSSLLLVSFPSLYKNDLDLVEKDMLHSKLKPRFFFLSEVLLLAVKTDFVSQTLLTLFVSARLRHYSKFLSPLQLELGHSFKNPTLLSVACEVPSFVAQDFRTPSSDFDEFFRTLGPYRKPFGLVLDWDSSLVQALPFLPPAIRSSLPRGHLSLKEMVALSANQRKKEDFIAWQLAEQRVTAHPNFLSPRVCGRKYLSTIGSAVFGYLMTLSLYNCPASTEKDLRYLNCLLTKKEFVSFPLALYGLSSRPSVLLKEAVLASTKSKDDHAVCFLHSLLAAFYLDSGTMHSSRKLLAAIYFAHETELQTYWMQRKAEVLVEFSQNRLAAENLEKFYSNLSGQLAPFVTKLQEVLHIQFEHACLLQRVFFSKGYTAVLKQVFDDSQTFSEELFAELFSNSKVQLLGKRVIVLAGTLFLKELWDSPKYLQMQADLKSKEIVGFFVTKANLQPVLKQMYASFVQGSKGFDKFAVGVFEALVGSLLLDKGFRFCENFLNALFMVYLEEDEKLVSHAKTQLFVTNRLMINQQKEVHEPRFATEQAVLQVGTETEPRKVNGFKCKIFIGDRLVGEGEAETKTLAETKAAEQALSTLVTPN